MLESLEHPRTLADCTFLGWPALRLHQGPLQLHVVPQIGGRLMSICYGTDELCFINQALVGRIPLADGSDWAELCGDWGFPLWGGGKTWIAPESMWPDGAPHPDLDSGAYTVRDTWIDEHSMGVQLQSPICRLSGLQIERRIELFRGETRWSVTQSVTNLGTVPHQCGAWDVLMLRRPATVLIPLPSGLGDHREAVRPIAGKGPVNDLYEAGIVEINQGMLSVFCSEAIEFKIGVLSDYGEMQVQFDASGVPLIYRRRSNLSKGERYAHGHPVEVFSAPALPYFELESHSRLATLQPGESVTTIVDEELSTDLLAGLG